MALTKETKYSLANLALGVLLFLAYRFYTSAGMQPTDSNTTTKVFLEATLLYIAAALVITIRAYYRSIRFSNPEQSEKASSLGAYGALGADRLKTITLNIEVNKQQFTKLSETGALELTPRTFDQPIRQGDAVNARLSNGGLVQQVPTRVKKVDGVNQQIILERQIQ